MVSVVLCFPQSSHPQAFHPDSSLGYTTYQHESGIWGGIYYKEMGGNDRIILEIYDLRYCSMDVVLFGISSMGSWDGLYNPNKINPYFQKADRDSAYALYKHDYGDRVISLTNGVFFESPTESLNTKLAYPLQYEGVVLSSGRSPYGPLTGEYPLKVLQMRDSWVEIHDYDHKDSLAMNNVSFQNQVVTLNYRNHPNIELFPQLTEGYKSRYHLFTAIDCDNKIGKETILILTSNYETSICGLAREMKQLHASIKDENILTLDGGSSISILDRDGKDIIETRNGAKVPMYFGFRVKGEKTSNVPRIMNPKSNDVVNANHPYYILYYSKDDINDFELYQDDKLVTRLHDIEVKLHEGIFVWDPTSCKPGDRYRLTIQSSGGREASSGYFTVIK
jgi:hypothetical protein